MVLKIKSKHQLLSKKNIYIMTAEERKEAGITDLPSTLHNALKALTEDEVVRAALGEHIYTSFLEAKRNRMGKLCNLRFTMGN